MPPKPAKPDHVLHAETLQSRYYQDLQTHTNTRHVTSRYTPNPRADRRIELLTSIMRTANDLKNATEGTQISSLKIRLRTLGR